MTLLDCTNLEMFSPSISHPVDVDESLYVMCQLSVKFYRPQNQFKSIWEVEPMNVTPTRTVQERSGGGARECHAHMHSSRAFRRWSPCMSRPHVQFKSIREVEPTMSGPV